MKLFKKMKDGGPESHVTGYFLIEAKSLFSVVLLHFAEGSREAYHNHAFNAISFVLRGRFVEHLLSGKTKEFKPSFRPKITPRTCFHKVVSDGNTWVLSFRGPWAGTWREWVNGKFQTLTNGRVVVNET